MSKHSPGKWIVSENDHYCEIRDGEHQMIGDTCASSCDGDIDLGRANARRIVACVNALEGLTTEQIEDGVFQRMRERRDFLSDEVNALTKQRDELLEALEAFSNYIHAEQFSTDGQVHYSDGQLTALAIMARKAIAKAKGGAA